MIDSMKRYLLLALFFALLPWASRSNAQEKTAAIPANPAREPMLVTVDWLADHLNDPSLVLLQIGEKKDYDKGHIPGAQFLEYESISTPHNHGVTLMLELPPVEQLVSVFERLGVSNRSHVILYFGTNWVSPTTRVYWTLDYLGLGDRTSILNGGLVAWEAAHHPVSNEVKQPAKGSITPAPRKEIVADADWVSAISINLQSPSSTRAPTSSTTVRRATEIPVAATFRVRRISPILTSSIRTTISSRVRTLSRIYSVRQD